MTPTPPVLGFQVLFHPRPDDNITRHLRPDGFGGMARDPLTALVVCISSVDISKVNLCVFDANGNPHGYTGVTLLESNDPDAVGELTEYAYQFAV